MTRSGGQMLIAQVEDTTGSLEVIVFQKLFGSVAPLFVNDEILIVKGRLRVRERAGENDDAAPSLSLAAGEVQPYIVPSGATTPNVSQWLIDISTQEQIDRLLALFGRYPGEARVILRAAGEERELPQRLGGERRVRTELLAIFGDRSVHEQV